MRSEKRNKQYDEVYMKMAEAFSELSYAKRNKVGAIIVSENDQVVSQGFNGTPAGFDNACEYEQTIDYTKCYDCYKEHCEGCNNIELITKPEVLHAEANAITKCAKNCISTKNSTMYVTLSPCMECAKLIIQSDIKRVLYRQLYRNTDGIQLLTKAGITVEQI